MSSSANAHGEPENEGIPSPASKAVLFVCLGNICRSPMAEAVFRSATKSHRYIGHIDSAGTGAYHEGDPPDPRTMDTLKDHNIVDYDHEARKVSASDFSAFDYILAMDKDNLSELNRARSRLVKKQTASNDHLAKIMLFGDFGGHEGEQVIDPYYGARNGFAVAYEQMVRFSKGFVEQVLDTTKEPA